MTLEGFDVFAGATDKDQIACPERIIGVTGDETGQLTVVGRFYYKNDEALNWDV